MPDVSNASVPKANPSSSTSSVQDAGKSGSTETGKPVSKPDAGSETEKSLDRENASVPKAKQSDTEETDKNKANTDSSSDKNDNKSDSKDDAKSKDKHGIDEDEKKSGSKDSSTTGDKGSKEGDSSLKQFAKGDKDYGPAGQAVDTAMSKATHGAINGRKDLNKKAEMLGKVEKAKMAAAPAGILGRFWILNKLLMMMKQFIALMVQFLATVLQAAVGWLFALGHAIASAVTTAVSAIATALSVSVAVAAVILGGPIVLVAVVVVAGVASSSDNQTAIYDTNTYTENCAEQAYNTVYEIMEGETDGISNQALDSAQKITSTLYQWGYSDRGDDEAIIMITAILGNWNAESGIDYATIEVNPGYYTGWNYGVELYTLGPIKQQIMADFSTYSQSLATMAGHNERGYISNGKYWCGIGLGQWTGPRCESYLDYCDTNSIVWYSLDANLQYLLYENHGHLSEWGVDGGSCSLTKVDATSSTALDDAVHDFMMNWEGVNYHEDKRKASAEKLLFYVDAWITGGDIDTAYASSIIGAANTSAAGASNDAVSSMMDDCSSFHAKYNNASSAAAMVSMSYMSGYEAECVTGNPDYDIEAGVGFVQGSGDYSDPAAVDSNATEYRQGCTGLYLKVKGALVDDDPSGDTYYSSCDRGVVTALRWSGTDDDCAWGGANNVGNSLALDTEHWDHWTWDGDYNSLEPGDVLYKSSHILMYVGTGVDGGIVASKYKDRVSADKHYICHSSYGDRGIKCAVADGYLENSTWTVCRNKKKEESPAWVNILDEDSATDDVTSGEAETTTEAE